MCFEVLFKFIFQSINQICVLYLLVLLAFTTNKLNVVSHLPGATLGSMSVQGRIEGKREELWAGPWQRAEQHPLKDSGNCRKLSNEERIYL